MNEIKKIKFDVSRYFIPLFLLWLLNVLVKRGAFGGSGFEVQVDCDSVRMFLKWWCRNIEQTPDEEVREALDFFQYKMETFRRMAMEYFQERHRMIEIPPEPITGISGKPPELDLPIVPNFVPLPIPKTGRRLVSQETIDEVRREEKRQEEERRRNEENENTV